jgi:signal transduction histidine kinase
MKTKENGRIPLFASLPDSEIVRLLASMKRVSVPEGTLIIQEGVPGDRFYLVIDGQLEVIKALGTQDERFLGNLEPGDGFGEMSLFDPAGLRVASVRARTAANLYEMAHADFHELIHRWPSVAFGIASTLSQRLCTSHNNTIRDLQEKNRLLAQAYRELQHAQGQIIEREQNLSYLMAQVLTAQEQERERLSRDLHDDLGQSLMILKLHLRAIERAMPANLTEQKQELAVQSGFIDDIVNDVRRFCRDLRPTVLDDLGLIVALKRFLEEFGALHGIEVSLDLDDVGNLLSPQAQIITYRIFQESFTNIGKYAQASRVAVSLKNENDKVSFSVEDNGKGFDLEQVRALNVAKRGLGLTAMEERVRMLGGVFKIQSQIGVGTRISFKIPVQT